MEQEVRELQQHELFEFWNDSTELYGPEELAQNSGSIKREKNMFALEITNTGDTICFFNGRILYPGVPGTSIGGSISMGHPIGKIFKGKISLAFDFPLGAKPEIEVSQLYYI